MAYVYIQYARNVAISRICTWEVARQPLMLVLCYVGQIRWDKAFGFVSALAVWAVDQQLNIKIRNLERTRRHLYSTHENNPFWSIPKRLNAHWLNRWKLRFYSSATYLHSFAYLGFAYIWNILWGPDKNGMRLEVQIRYSGVVGLFIKRWSFFPIADTTIEVRICLNGCFFLLFSSTNGCGAIFGAWVVAAGFSVIWKIIWLFSFQTWAILIW